jgi:Rieske Fe-S protein
MSTRRDFLTGCGKVASGLVLGYVALPILESCAPTSVPIIPQTNTNPVGPDGRVAVDVSDLTDSNPAKLASGVIGPDGMPVLITRLSATTFDAFSTQCTHASCQINSMYQNGSFTCPCHGSQFALDGSVKTGPAPSPLKSYNVIYDATAKVVHVKIA